MIDKLKESAERTASNLSRRRFLSRLSQMAMATTGAIAGLLSMTSEASGRGKACTTSSDCNFANGSCCNGRCIRLKCPFRSNPCGCNCCR